MKKKSFFFRSLFLTAITGFISADQSNTAPEIRFLEPQKPYYSWNSDITYRLQVTDKEDGSSAYEEIIPAEVFLMVRYLDDSTKLKILLTESRKDEPVISLLKNNHCFNCHSVKNKLAGPGFESIIAKYGSGPSVISYLAGKIIQGSRGVWGDSQQMPSHPEIREPEAKAIAQWMLRNATIPGFDFMTGLEGTIRFPSTRSTNKKGLYVLHATYTDHGLQGQYRKTADQLLVLYPH